MVTGGAGSGGPRRQGDMRASWSPTRSRRSVNEPRYDVSGQVVRVTGAGCLRGGPATFARSLPARPAIPILIDDEPSWLYQREPTGKRSRPMAIAPPAALPQ